MNWCFNTMKHQKFPLDPLVSPDSRRAFPPRTASMRRTRAAHAARLFLCSACCSLPLWLWVGTARAQVAAWDVNGRNAAADYPFAATFLDSHWSGATLTLGGGVSPSGTSNTFGGFGFDQTSLAGAMAAGDHLTITLLPAPGNSFSLSSVTLLFGVGTAVTNFNVALASNRTGFTVEDVLWNFSFGTASPPAQTIALSDFPAMADIASAIEFRLYGWRDTAGTTTFRIRDNAGGDLSFAGVGAAIPEPSTYAAILGAAGLLLAVAGRRKARASGRR